jgi:hypothetical protein
LERREKKVGCRIYLYRAKQSKSPAVTPGTMGTVISAIAFADQEAEDVGVLPLKVEWVLMQEDFSKQLLVLVLRCLTSMVQKRSLVPKNKEILENWKWQTTQDRPSPDST